MKKIFLTSAFILSLSGLQAEFYIKLDDKQHKGRYVTIIEFNEFGFNLEGIHKITNTEYDEEGFNQEGFNSSGIGRRECREQDSQNYASHNAQYSYWSTYRWDGQVAPSQSGNLYFTYVDLKDMYRYTRLNGTHVLQGNNYVYDICRFPVTREYVIGLTSHPNISLGGHDFWNFEYWTND